MESKIYVNGFALIASNTASENGGGIYLSQSELYCQMGGILHIRDNIAAEKGGGIHAIGSTIKDTATAQPISEGYLLVSNNSARNGGGLSMETNAKFYILKTDVSTSYTIRFAGNSATNYGGAVYVNDNTYSAAWSSQSTECFFQALTLSNYDVDSQSQLVSIEVEQNYANESGSTLFGGLLNRCTVSPFAEILTIQPPISNVNGVTYFNYVTNDVTLKSIASYPVQVCHCISKHPNCTFQYPPVKVKRGERFSVSVVAVDQIGNPVEATIQTILNFNESGLAEGQLTRMIAGECTELTFNVISPQDSEKLTLYASDGPCKDADLSTLRQEVLFHPCTCPVSFQPSANSQINCTCECDSDIAEHVECDIQTQSFVRKPQSNAWISNISDENTTEYMYLVFPNCPYDYCNSNYSVKVNLSQPNGADAQCAFNRSLLLCGSCKTGLSLSLGSSRCLLCPSYWPALPTVITIVAAIAGIALVTVLLMLNMTVAVGTLNGLIFYANIVAANRGILLPFSEPNFVTIFVSWLNLEFGFDSCYFEGMDAYTKTWLQLAFPVYILFLVVLVIIISSYSSKFSSLIGRKNPVATLATLILLSYAKVLEVTFRSLTSGTLVYPNGSSEMVWLPDATVKYLTGKHVALFAAAIILLLVGLVYSILLFSWQWLLRLPRWKIFKWVRNQKLHGFLETYHVPYTPKHRYWTGLLLLARAILYLIAAVNVSNDPLLALMSIIFVVTGILFVKCVLCGGLVYRKRIVDVIETVFYFNILAFAILTWYRTNNKVNNDLAIAYTSVIVTFILLLLIILYHVNTYTMLFSRIHKTRYGQRLNTAVNAEQIGNPQDHVPLLDADNELLDVIDYEPPEPTVSVVEIHHPHLPRSQPEDVYTQTPNIPAIDEST